MDYMPHREDEMVVDEDTFLNSSTNIDPSLLFQSQSQSQPSNPTSMAPTASTTPLQSFPLTEFYEYRHAGCLCKVKPESFPNIELQLWEPPSRNESLQSTEVSQPTKLWIIHPLHCNMCSWAESQRIYYTTQARCQAISEKTISDEIKNRLIAYEKGLHDGRIKALDMPLDWSEIHGSEKGGKVAREMARLMEGLDLKGDEAVEEELVRGVEGMGVGYDVLEYDLMREIELGEVRERGRVGGVGVQGRRERGRLARRVF
ncbi:hypothetical protein DL98DRAFT_585159 [Cadophora sp. DSE1049]|nr:hypothetical protein DL98DRAFT_585159 [Cadophora sp. DSE1049]